MRSRSITLFPAFLVGAIQWPSAFAATLHVPGDYPTIQSCIDAAVSGQDECIVAPGTYNELINFIGKGITLRSSEGPDVTFIDGTGLGGTVVTCNNFEGSDTVLEGFTITGGTGSSFNGYQGAGGMLNYFQVSPNVINCTFAGNTAELGGPCSTTSKPARQLLVVIFSITTPNTARWYSTTRIAAPP